MGISSGVARKANPIPSRKHSEPRFLAAESARLLPFRHFSFVARAEMAYALRVPHRRSWGVGRSCLMVSVAEPVASALVGVGVKTKCVADETSAIAELGREPFVAAIVSHDVGPAAISSLVSCAKMRHPEVAVVVLGSTSTVEEAVEVMRRGATDYLPPPLELPVLLLRLQRIVEARAAAEPTVHARSAPKLPGLIGSSSAMGRVYDTIEKVSRYRTNILLLGESGTGKELIARALHARGPRRQHLFVPLNCATLGRELLENELFGHERGAFTGANERKKGLFELADGGTLFLDEIAEMDPSTQAKLLRVLERNEFRRVGGTEKVKVDLSVVAATNRNLSDLIASGRFREDLYYRLKVVTLVVPPLRERREDIPALIDFFIDDFNRRNDGKIKGISPQLLRRFMEHGWPGNVRELKNAVESAAVLAPGHVLDQTVDGEGFEAPASPPTSRSFAPAIFAEQTASELRIPLPSPLAEVERRVILAQVLRCATKREAAETLGIGLRTLYTKLREYGLEQA
jgi:DNA-binding NtrC family response regulator